MVLNDLFILKQSSYQTSQNYNQKEQNFYYAKLSVIYKLFIITWYTTQVIALLLT